MNDLIQLRDGTKCLEKYVCRCQHCESHPRGPEFADDRYSLGIYAGRMCDVAWKASGFRDEGPDGFDAADAGERYEADY